MLGSGQSVSDDLGIVPPGYPINSRGVPVAPPPASVPAGSPGAGRVITPADAARMNAADPNVGQHLPVMSTDFVFGKGRAPPPGAGSVSGASGEGAPDQVMPAPVLWQAPGPLPVQGPLTEGAPARAPEPGRFQPISGELHDFVLRNNALEGSGSDPRSSAVGGFIEKTWLSVMRRHFPGEVRGLDDQQILAMRRDPHAREQAAAAYAADNAHVLSAAGQPVTPATMRLAHFLGPQGAVSVLSAPPETPVKHLLSKAAIDANPGTLAGNTAGGVRELIERQMSGDTPHSQMRPFREVAFGGFNSSASPLIQNWQADLQRRGKAYDAALAEAKDLRAAARAALGRWAEESNKPPQHMHEAWQQWSGIAGAFALLGGLLGNNHTAAIAAAGAMLQAANAADAQAYDKAYGQWKDHQERGLKLIELLNSDARNIVDDARKSYEEKITELNTLSTAYGLSEKLDPASVYNQTKQLELAHKYQDLIQAQHEDEAVKDLARKAKEANPSLSDGEAYARAKAQLRAGIGGWVVMTDPVQKDDAGNQIQYRYNPNTGEATTLRGEPYQPGGAQKLGATSQAAPNPQQVEYVAKGIAEYRLPPLSGYALRSPFGQAVTVRLMEMNPQYEAGQYRSRYIGETRFTTGKQADTIRSFGVSIDHLATMQEAADALANDDIQMMNRAKNRLKAELGYEGPVDFNFVKSIVGAEVTKAIIGGVGALADREELRAAFDVANSPQQLAGVSRMARRLMAGQLSGLRQQARGIGWSDERFNEQLSPLARQELLNLERDRPQSAAPAGAASSPASAGAVPPAAGAGTINFQGRPYELLPSGAIPVPDNLKNTPDGKIIGDGTTNYIKKGERLILLIPAGSR